MKNDTLGLAALAHHAFPAALFSQQEKQLRSTLTMLEAAIVTSTDNKMLLLAEETVIQQLLLIAIERFLLYTQCQRILLLINPKSKDMMEQALSWEDGHALKDHFVMTTQPQHAQQAHVCLVTVAEIQKELGMQTQSFLHAFDIVLLYDVSAHPGPVWSQIVDQCAAGGACVIGLSSTLSVEQGKYFFERVIDAKGVPGGRVVKHR